MHPALNHQLQVARAADLRPSQHHPVLPLAAQPTRRRLRDLLGHARPGGTHTR